MKVTDENGVEQVKLTEAEYSGEYIKYDNGIMFAWGKMRGSTFPVTVYYPIPFIAVPTVIATGSRSNYFSCNGSSNNGPYKLYFQYYMKGYNGDPIDTNSRGSWQAFGRWK